MIELKDGLEAKPFGDERWVGRFTAKRVDGRWVFFEDGREIAPQRWKRAVLRAQKRWLFSGGSSGTLSLKRS